MLMLLTQYCFAVPPSNFAYRSGRNFMLNGQKFYYGGDNLYYLGINTDNAHDDVLTASCQTAGVTVIRMWAFNNGASYAIQPTLGTWNETALQQLDYAVRDAEIHGEKVILTLNNYWSDFNGMQWYVDQVEGTGHSVDDFYTNSGCQTAFKNYISMLLNRTNHYTGIQYKNDPGVFAWELANEPRCPSDPTGTTLYNWVHMMASYVKGLDTNHMVSTGDEGFKVGSGSDWTTNGYTGVDFARNIQDVNIDFGTQHLYPGPLDWNETGSWVSSTIADRASIAHVTANKPIVLEEFGEEDSISTQTADMTTWMGWAYSAANDYDGIMAWQMEETQGTGNSFTFLFTNPTGVAVTNMCVVQAFKYGPSAFTATSGNAVATLSWQSTFGATSYNVYRGATAGGESGTPIATGITSTSYTNSGLTNGATYYYKVSAVNASATSSQSNEAVATPSLGAPMAPTGLAGSPGSSQVGLSWNSSSGATSYNVYRGTSAGGESGTAIATGITSTTYTNTGLTNGTTYFYKVAAVNAGGTSGMSNEVSATPTASTPATASFVKADTTTKGTWKGVYGLDGYHIANDTSSNNPAYPAYATVSNTGFTNTWAASTTDARALTWAASGATNRIAAQWNSSTTFTIDCNLTDANTHNVALYCLDWDGAGVRAESIQVQDAGTGTVLNTQNVASFQNGTWEVWAIKGHVKFVVTTTGGANSAVSGIFFR